MPRTFMQISTEKTALFLFSIFFITVLLIVAIVIPNPTDANWRVFNLVLVAAAIGVVLPEACHLQFTPWLKANNAFDLYLLSYDDFKIRQQSCDLTRSWMSVNATSGVTKRQREST